MSLCTSTVLEALRPAKVTAFGVQVRPVTMGHLVAIEMVVPDFFEREGHSMLEMVVVFALVRCGAREAVELAVEFAEVGLDAAPKLRELLVSAGAKAELAKVAGHLGDSWRTFLPPKSETRRSKLQGLGFVAEAGSMLMREYRMSWDEAVFELPLAVAGVLLAACHHAAGGTFLGPDYRQRDQLRSR